MKFILIIFILLLKVSLLMANETKSAKDYYNDGLSKVSSGDNKGAILDFDKAIEIDPKDADSYKKRGISKATLGDYEGANQDFKKAETLSAEKPSVSKESGPNQNTPKLMTEEKKKEEEERKREEEKLKKYYAKLKNPPGFYEGAFLISFMGGTTIAPSGSYISHEKVYDQRLQGKIITNQVNQDLDPNLKGFYFQPSYKPGVATQFDFEYGWRDKIGMGFTIMQNSITAQKQDVIPGVISYANEYAEIFPSKRTIYRGTSMMFLATYHPLPKHFFDPYLAVRMGIVGFTGEAHSGIDSNRFAYTNKVNNGMGGIAGLAGGLNIYIGRFTGIKTEVAYHKEYLRADQFSTRTLNSYQAMIGFFLNFSNIQYSLKNPTAQIIDCEFEMTDFEFKTIGWFVLRCTHFILGFILFGVIYYLGMFTSRVVREMDKDMRKAIVPNILPAYFHWLKWEALWTVLSGFALFFWKIVVLGHSFVLYSKYALFMLMGMSVTIGITFTIWFVILPLQDRILELTKHGEWTEELDSIVWRSRKFAHISSWLGILVVVFMVGANYFPYL